MKKAIFLDRDGVINELSNSLQTQSPRSLKSLKLKKHLIQVAKYLKTRKYLLIMITNQPDVSRKIISKSSVEKINKYIKQKIQLDDIFICYSKDDRSFRRKPNPGMLLEAKKKWNISFSKSYLIGDREKDIKAGKSVGVKTILLPNKKKKPLIKIKGKFTINSLKQVIKLIK